MVREMAKIKKLELITTLKDSLNEIGAWDALDSPEMTKHKKYYVSLKLNTEIKKKYNLNGTSLDLIYCVGKNFASYSPNTSSLYDLAESDLIQLAGINDFKIIKFPKNVTFKKDGLTIIKNILEMDILIIPLDNKILIEVDNDDIGTEMNLDGNKSFVVEEIIVKS